MPTFNDSENRLMFQPAGDYIFTVIGHEKKIVNGGKCAGADMDALQLEIKSAKGVISTLFDNLIDSPKTAWKYDVFLKSSGIKIQKGQQFQFVETAPDGAGDINPLGLRGWCQVGEDAYNGKKKNVVTCYYTDRVKLTPITIEREQPDDADRAAFGEPAPTLVPESPPIAGDEPIDYNDDPPF